MRKRAAPAEVCFLCVDSNSRICEAESDAIGDLCADPHTLASEVFIAFLDEFGLLGPATFSQHAILCTDIHPSKSRSIVVAGAFFNFTVSHGMLIL